MQLVSTFFWISIWLLLYLYIGYGILLWLITRFKKRNQTTQSPLPKVTLIIPCYHEATHLPQKINNCRDLNYPANKLKILFVVDGNTDDSAQIITQFKDLQLLHSANRQGKMAAINKAMPLVTTPIVIFSDANTLLNPNAIQEIVKHYAYPNIGGVAGEKKVNRTNTPIGQGEGLYWRYESMLKQLDSDFNTVIGAAGELFSMRTNLFQPQKSDTILDDFMLWAAICNQGYKVCYEPNAYATEQPSADTKEELKRRVRIAAGAFQSMGRLGNLFNLFKHPLLTFQYISRRILRWVCSPFALIVCFFTNIILAFATTDTLYSSLFLMQLVFYSLAFVGAIRSFSNKKSALLFFVPFYFVFMNMALLMGLQRFVTGNYSVYWTKSKRMVEDVA
jgi:cellulose synthase/poly-beta-1,6-N-acetylglucosamine synthase-like glycosyltransferase